MPTNFVHSEPTLLLDLLRQCTTEGLSEAATVGVLRAAVLAMGRSRFHHDMFVELSWPFVPHMGLFIKAFPEALWALSTTGAEKRVCICVRWSMDAN